MSHKISVTLIWIRYSNFFDLWRAQRQSTRLIYVIGEHKHCYIGSIGSRGGLGGLGTRYQWQYVCRAKAIFGLDEQNGQECYCAVLPESIRPDLILSIEAKIQSDFITRNGPENSLFEPEDDIEELLLQHTEDVPLFLQENRTL